MAENLDPKNLDKFVKNMKAAQEYSKEVNESFAAWGRSAAKIKEYSDAIKNRQKIIAELQNQIADATEEEKEQLEAQIAYEQEKIKLNQEQLKLLKKQRSTLKTLANETISFLGKQGGLVNKVVDGFTKMDGSARRISVEMGMGTLRMSQFQMASAQAAQQLELIGIEAAGAAEMMSSYADETGRQVILGKTQLVQMGALSKRTGMAHTEMAGLAGQMESFGIGADDSVELISEIADMSDKMGVNTAKVIKKVQGNLKLVNKLSFKGGIRGMAQMAAHAEKYKINMEEVAGFAEKVFRPEGAIDAAANLQVLGGSLANMGDPFQLMYQARHAPEELAKSLTKAAAQSAVFNKTTGEFEVNALELDRLREASEATGMSMEMLVGVAKQSAKMNMFEDVLKVGGEDKEFLSSIAEMKDGKAQIAIDVDPKTGEKQYAKLSELSASEQMAAAKRLKKEKESNEEAARRAQASMELMRNSMNALLASFYPVLVRLDKTLRPWIEWFVDQTLWLGSMIKKYFSPLGAVLTAFALKFGIKMATWIMRGRWLGMGFNMTAGKGGMLSRMFGGKGGGGPVTKSGKPDMRFKANKTAMGGQSAKGLGATGKAVGGFSSAVGSAAQIIAIAGALWILSDAIVKLAEIPWPNLLMATGVLLALGVGLAIFMNFMAGLGLNPAVWLGVALLLAVGAAFMMLGAAIYFISAGVALIVESFTGLFSVINADNIGALLLLGPALAGIGLGMMVLTASLIGFGLAWLIGGWAFEDMAESIGALGNTDLSGLGTAVQAINNVDMNKIEALRDLASALSLFSLFSGGGIKIDFGDLDVKGKIDLEGEGGGRTSTDWVEDPIFVSKLKDLIWETMEADKTGGKP